MRPVCATRAPIDRVARAQRYRIASAVAPRAAPREPALAFGSRRTSDADGTPKSRDLRRRERARGAEREPTERERTERDPLQLLRTVPDRVAQPAHEMRASLVNDDAQPRLRRQLLFDGHLRWAGFAVGEPRPAPEPRECALVRTATHLYPIRPRHVVARVHEARRQLTVVGEEHESGRLHVEPADGKDARQLARKQRAYRRPSFGIA